jgi:hypothetical protein
MAAKVIIGSSSCSHGNSFQCASLHQLTYPSSSFHPVAFYKKKWIDQIQVASLVFIIMK